MSYWKYYVNCFKNGEPTYAADYVEANSEEEAINKAIEPYDKNAYEFLELKKIYLKEEEVNDIN